MKKINLTRREFLKIAGISAGVLTAYPLIEKSIQLFPEAHFGNLLFRGSFDGVIQSSSDEGQTWEKMMNFGTHIQVVEFDLDQEKLIATLKLGKYKFLVESSDGRIWKTVD